MNKVGAVFTLIFFPFTLFIFYNYITLKISKSKLDKLKSKPAHSYTC